MPSSILLKLFSTQIICAEVVRGFFVLFFFIIVILESEHELDWFYRPLLRERFKTSGPWIFPGKYHYFYFLMLNYINFHLIFLLLYLLSQSRRFFIH